jgi:hypothetical protein
MAYSARVVHHSPGRIRLRAPEAKGRKVLFHRFREAISAIQGVENVETNHRTGSMLVHYDPDELHDIVRGLRESAEVAGLLSITEPEFRTVEELEESGAALVETNSRTVNRLTDVVAELDYRIKQATNNELDLGFLAPTTVALLGILSSRGRTGTPLWISLSTFAINSFVSFHEARHRRQFQHLVLERVLPAGTAAPMQP